MKLIIMAGGKGTRLGLKKIPKPMVKIGGKPILEHQIELAKKYGIREIILITGFLYQKIIDHFGDGSRHKVKITNLIEYQLKGTGGCLRLLKNFLHKKERFIVLSGDLMTNINLAKLIADDKCYGSFATVVAHLNDHPEDSDLIEVDSRNRIITIHSKPHLTKKYNSDLALASIGIFSSKIISYVPINCFSSLWSDVLPTLLSNKELIYAYKSRDYIKDIGILKRLKRARIDYTMGKI